MQPPSQGPSKQMGAKDRDYAQHLVLTSFDFLAPGSQCSQSSTQLVVDAGCHFNPLTGHHSLDFLQLTRLFQHKRLW